MFKEYRFKPLISTLYFNKISFIECLKKRNFLFNTSLLLQFFYFC